MRDDDGDDDGDDDEDDDASDEVDAKTKTKTETETEIDVGPAESDPRARFALACASRECVDDARAIRRGGGIEPGVIFSRAAV